MDRYHSHTIHCRSCPRALIWIRRAKPIGWGLLWAGAILWHQRRLGLISLGLISVPRSFGPEAGQALGTRSSGR
ncbi:MAG: hypothetical protein CM15mP77_0330 [Synechococcus sp.]|nr:MAG: hypothetical protein CM15mP77_0330 [Synechococcus sp.]